MRVADTLPQLKIGDNVSSKVGEKVSGKFKIAERAASSIELPVTIIQSKTPGPTLVLIAGEHGGEYCGIVAAVRIIRDIMPDQIRGTLIVIPLANPPAFDERSLFVNPLDMANLYGSYPGDLQGTVTHVMAYRLFHEVALKADYLVHLHGADYNESLVPFSYYAKTTDLEVTRMSRRMAECFPVNYLLESEILSNSESNAAKGTTYPSAGNGTLFGEVSQRGIPATMCEAGREGKVETQFAEIHYNGVLNIMGMVGLLPDRERSIGVAPNRRILYDPTLVIGNKPGIFDPLVQTGDQVTSGQKIAQIMNFSGETIEEIISPITGLVVDRINFAAVDGFPSQKQPYLFYIAKLRDA